MKHLTAEEQFVYNSVNNGGDTHIPYDQISDSIRQVWVKIYKTQLERGKYRNK